MAATLLLLLSVAVADAGAHAPPAPLGPANDSATGPCAIVLKLAVSGTAAEAVHALCAVHQTACDVYEQGRHAVISRACDVVDHDMYVQRAVYFAASRDADGHRQARPAPLAGTVVLLSAGRHRIRVAQPSWYPFGAWTGLHIPSGVLLRGSNSSSIVLDEACVKRAGTAACIDGTTPLDNIILISDYRVGAANMSIDELFRPAIGAGVESLAVSGWGELAVNGIALQGINISVRSSTIANVTAGISGGYFTQFIAASSSEGADPAVRLTSTFSLATHFLIQI